MNNTKGSVYTKRQRQRRVIAVMTPAILVSLKSIESAKNRVPTHSGVTALFSEKVSSLALTLR